MHRRILTLTFVLLTLPPAAFAQGTPSMLRCAFTGSIDVHATQDAGSPVIGKVACGSPIQLLDNRTGVPHIRLEDGKDGYITRSTLGWAIDSGSFAAPTAPAQSPASPQSSATAKVESKKATDSAFRRYEVGFLASYWRDSGANFGGMNVSFVVNANERFGIVARLDGHRDLDFSQVDIYTPTLGLRAYVVNSRPVTVFLEAGFGGLYVTNGANSINGYSQRLGGAIDVNIKPWIHWRMIEVNHTLLRTGGNYSNGAQAATGLAFRFGKD